MKIPTLLRGLCAMLMIYTLAACSAGEGGGGSEASRRHAAMRAALPDSVAKYTALQASLQSQIDTVSPRFNALLEGLEMDTREEYVEHYRVARGWRGYDTMSKTGILARMLEDGTVEIVATNTSIPFVSITLSADGESVKSDDVQRGSDLNYTVGNTTRAAFMGEDAQRLCDFASRHVDGSVTLSFNGAKSQRIVLSQRQKGMLAIFSRVISAKQQLDSLQRGFMVAFNKMQLYRNEVTKDSIANSKKEE